MIYKFSFFAVFFSIILKLIAIHFTNFDLFGDEAQYWLWSKSPELGYYSKPPLLAWLLNLHTIFFGNSFESLKYFPLIFYFFTSYVVYLLSYELYKNNKIAIISALTFCLLPSVSVSSFLISTDIILILFCSLSLLVLLKIRKNPNIINFIILGIFFGLSFLTKYAAIYYIISFIIIIILDNKFKEIFIYNFINFFIFFISFIIVFFPNIFWNIQNNWITLSHTSDNAGLNRINLNIVNGLEFISSQVIMLGPLLFVFFIVYLKKLKFTFETKFLLVFSLPVFFIVFVESIFVRANANWAAVGLIPFFLLMINQAYNYSKNIILYNNIINLIFCLFLFVSIAISSNIKIFNRINGISNFAYSLQNKYLQNTNYLIIEDRLLYSNLNFYLKNEKKIILTPYNPIKKIKSHFHISKPLMPNHNKNFIFIGNPASLNYLNKKFNIYKKEEIDVKFVNQPIEIYEVVF